MGEGGGGGWRLSKSDERAIFSIISVFYDDNTTAPYVLVIFLSNMSACEMKMLKCKIEVAYQFKWKILLEIRC